MAATQRELVYELTTGRTETDMATMPRENATAVLEGPQQSEGPRFQGYSDERVLICPAKPWIPLNLKEIWSHRSLLALLLYDEVRKSYVGTWLGVAWLFLQPLFTALVFALVFTLFARVPTNGIPSVLFYLSGLVPWMFFSGALTRASRSISGEAALLKKVYFPRALMPIVKVSASLVDFVFGFAVFFTLIIALGQPLEWRIVFVPFFILLMYLFALGLGFWISALEFEFPDVGRISDPVIRFWMYLSPVVYPASLVGEGVRSYYLLNPIASCLEGCRWSLFAGFELPVIQLGISCFVVISILISGAYFFRRREARIADYA
jgi:lipopolysaccharide transport system permease protein